MLNALLGRIVGSKAVAALLVVQAFLAGKKSYLAGSILVLQGASCLLEQILGLHGLADALALLRGLGDNACLTQIAQGLGIMGLRAAAAKSAAVRG